MPSARSSHVTRRLPPREGARNARGQSRDRRLQATEGQDPAARGEAAMLPTPGAPAGRDTAASGRTGRQAREETLARFPAAHPSQHGPREITDQDVPFLGLALPGQADKDQNYRLHIPCTARAKDTRSGKRGKPRVKGMARAGGRGRGEVSAESAGSAFLPGRRTMTQLRDTAVTSSPWLLPVIWAGLPCLGTVWPSFLGAVRMKEWEAP